MKCPDCNFVCSDLRDVCPKCYVDLREFKSELGIPVTNPRATYEQLLERAGLTRTKLPDDAPNASTHKGFRGFLASFFGASPPTAHPLDPVKGPVTGSSTSKDSAQKRVSTSDEVRESLPESARGMGVPVISVGEELSPSPKADFSPPPELRYASPPDELSFEKVGFPPENAGLSSESSVAPPPSAQVSPLAEVAGYRFNLELPPLAPEQGTPHAAMRAEEVPEPPSFNDGMRMALEAQLISRVLEAASEEVREAIPRASGPLVQEEERPPAPMPAEEPQEALALAHVVEGEVKTESFATEIGVTEIRDETSRDTEAELARDVFRPHLAESSSISEAEAVPLETFATPPATNYEQVTASLTLGPELDALFAETLGDLCNTNEEDSLELSSEHFYSNVQPEKVAVLFEMTREALLDPESESRYTDEIETSSRRHVESEEMTAQLRNVVQVMNAPMVTLKGRQGLGLSGKSIEPEGPEHWEPSSVSASRRVAAFLVDALVLLFLTLLSTSALLVVIMPDFDAVLLGDRIPNIFDVINVATYGTLSGIFLSVFLPALSLSLWSSTPGLSAMGLLALSMRGKSVGKAQALVRSVVLPFSVLFLGWIPVLLGKRSLHDAAARTVVAKKQDR
jgi:uncharacterized RDD family membrane protein YckC